MKGISKDQHGLIDYAYVPLVAAAPQLFGFEEDKEVSSLCYVTSATVLGYTILTDAKWGAVKLIPYKAHLGLDLVSGVMALAAIPLLNVTNKKSRNMLMFMGFAGIVVGTLSLLGSRKTSSAHLKAKNKGNDLKEASFY